MWPALRIDMSAAMNDSPNPIDALAPRPHREIGGPMQEHARFGPFNVTARERPATCGFDPHRQAIGRQPE